MPHPLAGLKHPLSRFGAKPVARSAHPLQGGSIFSGGGGGLPAEDGVKRNNVFTDYTTGGQTISADSLLSVAYLPWEASDGDATPSNTGSSWISADTALPHWWQIDFGSAQAIYSVDITVRSVAGDEFDEFEIQSSDDGSTWTTRHSVTGQSWNTTDYTESFSLSTPASARYWRLNITSASDGGNRVAIIETVWKS